MCSFTFALGSFGELGVRQVQLGENIKVEVAQVETQQGIGLQSRQNLWPETLLVGLGARFVPNWDGSRELRFNQAVVFLPTGFAAGL